MSPSMQMSVEVLFINTSDRLSIYRREEAKRVQRTLRALGRGEKKKKGERTGTPHRQPRVVTKDRDTQVPNSLRGISVSMCGSKAWATLSH